MEVVFAKAVRRERERRGWLGVVAAWLGAAFDAVTRGAAERGDAAVRFWTNNRTKMSRTLSIGDRMMLLWQDIRYAVRGFLKRPGFAVVAMLTLAIGIGANTAMFSVVNGALLRPLPYDDPDQLALIWETFDRAGMEEVPFSEADFIDYRDQAETLSHIAMFRRLEDAILLGDGEPEVLSAQMVTPALFPMLGASALLGRVFDTEEEEPGKGGVAVLSHAFWQERFGGDADVVARTINLSTRSYTVVGVMPEGFQFPPPVSLGDLMISSQPDLWVPFTIDRANADRGRHGFFALGRAKDGVDLALVDAEMKTIAARVAEANPQSNTGIGARIVPVHEQSVAAIRSALLVLLGAVGCVLLIACTNVANLLLARAGARQREIAVRVAVGAGRGRLVRQLLTESMLMAVAGGGIGFALSVIGTKALFRINPMDLPLMFDAGVDLRVLAFTLGVTGLTGLAFGLIPALQTTRADLQTGLKEGSRSTTDRGQIRMKNLLIVGEIALALVLLVGAGLMIKSFDRLQSVDPGFDPENVLTFLVPLSEARYPEPERQRVFVDAVVERVSGLPGVHRVGGVSSLPLVVNRTGSSYTVEGEPPPEPGEFRIAEFRSITPGYFEAMGMPLLSGQGFSNLDGPDGQSVAVINETLASRHWDGGDPIGRRISGGVQGDQGPHTVVGIVSDVRFFGVDVPPEPMVYRPNAQAPNRGMWIAVRATGNPEALGNAIRGAVWDVDPNVPVEQMETMRSRFADSIAKPRFTAQLFTGFGLVALFLAALGIYGVMSFAVAQQTKDIGVRMAFGAEPRRLLAMVLARGLALSGTGVGIGLLGAIAATRLMRSLLYDVSATDPGTFAAVGTVLLGVAALATYLPARRATKVDPVDALRGE
jgi:putative ABC transport system permease protein